MRNSLGLVLGIAVGIALIAAGIVVAVLAVRGDGGGNPDAESWAGAVCSSIDEWQSSITSLADVTGETLTRDLLRERLDDASAATRDLVDQLESLGPPDLESGDELEQRLDEDVEALRSGYDELESKAREALDAGSATEFLSALAALATPYQALVNQISTTLDDLRNADDVSAEAREELQRGFDDAEACQRLRTEEPD
jgi:phage shock protein A